MKGNQRFGIKRVVPKDRKNVLSVQGRPKKALPFRDALYQWFVDIKGAVKTRISHKYVLANARRLLSEYVKGFLDAGMPIPKVPVLTRVWLSRWKFEHGVSFRKPNKRYKVSYAGLLLRLDILWSSNVCIRHFARRMLGGIDPGKHIDNGDQKG